MTAEIVCVGGANMDIRAKASGVLQRHASNPGDVSLRPGGVARNVAEGLARLGIGVALATAVGEDGFGRQLRGGLESLGIDATMVESIKGAATGCYCAVLDGGGEMSVAINAMDIMDAVTPEFLARHASRIAAARYVFADCNPPARTLAWLAQANGALIVDPVSPAKAARLRELSGGKVFALIANRYQAEALTGGPIASLAEAMEAASGLHAMGFLNVLLSLGRDGAIVATGVGSPTHLPTMARMVRDVTGAGDAASAGLIFGLSRGASFVEAARLGQMAAAIVLESGALSSTALAGMAPA
jgi:pseudouridine kinase